MKRELKSLLGWFAAGLIAAFGGVLFSDLFGDFFNGLPNGTGPILGMGVFLCVVLITCTGIVVIKIDQTKDDKQNEDKQ